MKIDDITSLRGFKLIFEIRSLTKASETMGLSKAALSKRLEALEQELKVKLFSRTTRSIVPTPAAEKLYPQVQEILEKLSALGKTEGSRQGKVHIRLTCIASISHRFLARALCDFRLLHPETEVELLVTDSLLDPVEHNLDLVVRTNPSKTSTLVGRNLGPLKIVAVGTPQYLKGKRKPKEAQDLLLHPLLFIDHHASVFSGLPRGMTQELKSKRAFTTNDSNLVSQLVLRGEALALRSFWDVKELLKEKKLALALPENYFRPQGEVWLLAGSGRLQSPEVRKLYDYLVDIFSEYLS